MELRLFDQHFEIYGDRFEYANVRRVRWLPQTRRIFLYFVPIGLNRFFELTIQFFDGPPLELGPGGFSSHLDARQFRSVCESMQQLLAKTRDVRLASYLEEITSNGAFEYDGKIFRNDGTVDYKGHQYTLDLRTKATAISTHTEVHCLPRGSLTMKTDWDRDCFHILLDDLHKQATAR